MHVQVGMSLRAGIPENENETKQTKIYGRTTGSQFADASRSLQ